MPAQASYNIEGSLRLATAALLHALSPTSSFIAKWNCRNCGRGRNIAPALRRRANELRAFAVSPLVGLACDAQDVEVELVRAEILRRAVEYEIHFDVLKEKKKSGIL